MNKSRLVGGIICLVLAAALAVLTIVLPEDSMMFMIGEQNMPFVPVVILAVIGTVLLATLGSGRQPEAQAVDPEMEAPVTVEDPEKAALNKRLETMAWGAFLIMLGGFALVPADIVPKGLWSIGVGLIMLGLNLARYLNRLKMSGFTTFLGVLSLVGGVLELIGWTSLEGGLLLIILGIYVIFKPWIDKNRIFGKAEES